MSKIISTSVIAVFGVAAVLQGASHRDYKLEEREAVRHTFSGDHSLDVDDINGFIHVIGDSGSTIRVEGEKVIRADERDEIQRAKREVTLDLNEKDGTAQVYENGPFRDNGHTSENHGFHEHRNREYEVTYNLTIHVPRATELRLYTVNGDLKAEDTSGKFDVHGINGSITMSNIAGSGRADTLNGPTVITFRENPKAESYFESFNGRVDITFSRTYRPICGSRPLTGKHIPISM